jgi:hypothetical protein
VGSGAVRGQCGCRSDREKDEAYREDFVRLLAEALLDGATDF